MSRFTIRELLVLVGCGLGPEQRVAYLSKAFDWYYDRTRNGRTAIFAGVIFLAGIVVSGDREVFVTVGAGVAAGLAVVGYLVAGRILVAPLHREYLCCLSLLHTLDRLRLPLQAAFEADGAPDASTYARAIGRSRVRDELAKAHERDPNKPRASQSDLDAGRCLFAVLGPVPTDDYERCEDVRNEVDGHLRKAVERRRPPNAVA